MKSFKSIQRKAEKARARRRDYVRRKNINNNVPTEKYLDRKEIFTHSTDKNGNVEMKNGRPKLSHIGYKTFIVKRQVPLLRDPNNLNDGLTDSMLRLTPMIQYPISKKYNYSK